MLRSRSRGLWLIATVFSVSAAYAAPSTGEAQFAEGATAFKAGKFETALRHFVNARAAGLDRPALHYNLGVTYYKLKQFEHAEVAFRAAARDPAWAPLAHYNIGLCLYQRGQRTAAADYFTRVWHATDDMTLRALAVAMLERVNATALQHTRSEIALKIGHDSNVTLANGNNTLQPSRQSDQFLELSAFATGWVGDKKRGRWIAGLYSISYDELTDFNMAVPYAGLSALSKFGNWYTEAGVEWQYYLRDGQSFQNVAALKFLGTREWVSGRDFRFLIRTSDINVQDDQFFYLDGARYELDFSTAQPAGDGRVRVGMKYDRYNREDLKTAGEFASFSPTRYELRLRGSWPVGRHWRIEPAIDYSHSRYADPEQRLSGLNKTREDDKLEVTARVRYRLNPSWELIGEYTYQDNDSNLDEFSYTRNLFMLGVSHQLN